MQVQLFAIKLSDEAVYHQLRNAFSDLTPAETKARCDHYLHTNDKMRCFYGELLIRYAIGYITGTGFYSQAFATGEKGKPYLKEFSDIHFNMSHSGLWVVVAIADKNVGIDVEKIRKAPLGVANRFFSEPEKNQLFAAMNSEIQQDHFFTLWTLKESFLKALGKGLTKSLSSFTVTLDKNGVCRLTGDPEAKGYYLKTIYLDEGYKMAVCAARSEFADQVIHILPQNLLSIANINFPKS